MSISIYIVFPPSEYTLSHRLFPLLLSFRRLSTLHIVNFHHYCLSIAMLQAMPRWLLHLDEWRVLVCTQCECSIAPAKLSKHLRRMPHHGLNER